MSAPLLDDEAAAMPPPPHGATLGKALAAGALILAGTALGAALAGAFFAFASHPHTNPPATPPATLSLFPPSCLTPLGGGAIRSGGTLPQPRTRSPACWPDIRAYLASGGYDADVAGAVSDAAAYLSSIPRPSPSAIVVLDVDETALSNRAEWLGGGEGEDDLAARLERSALRGDAPALAPTLRFYKAARAAGFTVAFVTGRSGRAEVRNATVANLASAGYGRACTDTEYEGDSAAAAPCYAALLMRPEREGAPASVVKPALRSQLLDRLGPGATLVAALGDNFSDLGGEPTPAAVFKLPNPVYYVV
jgi:hypothetical protein